MGCDVFISYSSLEKKYADQVKNVIETNGYSCWMAPESIPGGSSYADEIETAIQNCRVVVLILYETAQKSIWIPKEISRALDYKKIIIPFHIDESKLQKSFLFYLTDAQRIEAYKDLSKAYSELISTLRGILGNTNDIETKKETIKERTANYSACKIYISSDDGTICFKSDNVKSYDDICFFDFNEEKKNNFATKLGKLLAYLYQIDSTDISIEYLSNNNKVRLFPSSEAHWNAWSADEEYRVRFHVGHFVSEAQLLYDSFHFDLGKDLEISFFYRGNYINKKNEPILNFSQLGINEEETIKAAKELIELCYPKKTIKTQSKFVPVFYDDCSGGYHLKFLL